VDDQQRAKELLAQEYERVGALEAARSLRTNGAIWNDSTTIAAIASALATTALREAPEWQPIDTAPKDDRVLVRCESGSVYAAHWVQNQMTGEEAWLVCALEDGTQMLVYPVEWMPLPLAARPQGVKDAS
jgi:hypothetical protein